MFFPHSFGNIYEVSSKSDHFLNSRHKWVNAISQDNAKYGLWQRIGGFRRFVLLFCICSSVTNLNGLSGEYVKYSTQGTKIFENSPLENASPSIRCKFLFYLEISLHLQKGLLFATITSFSNFPLDFPLRIRVNQQKRRKLVVLNGISL